jgi:hypothetical protein
MSQVIKNTVYKYFSQEDTTNWIDIIDNIVNNYNNLPSRGICNLTPNEVHQYDGTTRECHLMKKNTTYRFGFKVGDIVRVLLGKDK